MKDLFKRLSRGRARRVALYSEVNRDLWAGTGVLCLLGALLCLCMTALEHAKMQRWKKRI